MVRDINELSKQFTGLIRGDDYSDFKQFPKPSLAFLEQYLFTHITAIGKHISENKEEVAAHAKVSAERWWTALSGAFSQVEIDKPVSMIFIGTGFDDLACFIGLPNELLSKNESDVLVAISTGVYGSAKGEFENIPSKLGSETLNFLCDLSQWQRIRTVPSSSDLQSILAPIDMVSSATTGFPWALIINAQPVQNAEIRRLLTEISNVKSLLKSEEQESMVVGGRTSTSHNTLVSDALSRATSAEKLLEEALTEGGWLVTIFTGSNSPGVSATLASILVSGNRAEEQVVQPPAITECGNKELDFPDQWHKIIDIDSDDGIVRFNGHLLPVPSVRLANMASMPLLEYHGFEQIRSANFDTEHKRGTGDRWSIIGKCVRSTGAGRSAWLDEEADPKDLCFDLDDLNRHILIAGVTGCGKTVTMVNILREMSRHNLPFMVVEPAKAEYKSKLCDISDLRILSLASGGSKLTINPFDVPRGVRVQSHLDHIKALFNASFVMYAPMPQVLEQSLMEIYQDLGWDLALDKNIRIDDHLSVTDAERRLLFPTLRDLYNKFEKVVDSLGYGSEITLNVKAALRTRIQSLRLGSKGELLDGPSTISMGELFDKPTVIELENISDDEEKAFVMGLIFILNYEHRIQENRGADSNASSKLKHLMVIEEAHRLLKATSKPSTPDSASSQAKSVEDFCNMLSEMRAYGQGFGICEQIPSKLALDVIKNTNTKIVHRLLAKDDRDLLAECMCMSEDQIRILPSLPPGRGAFFGEGMDSPLLADFRPPLPEVNSVSDIQIGDIWEASTFQIRVGEVDPRIRTSFLDLFRRTCVGSLDDVERTSEVDTHNVSIETEVSTLRDICLVWARHYSLNPSVEHKLHCLLTEILRDTTPEVMIKERKKLWSSIAQQLHAPIESLINERRAKKGFKNLEVADKAYLFMEPICEYISGHTNREVKEIFHSLERDAPEKVSQSLIREIRTILPGAQRELFVDALRALLYYYLDDQGMNSDHSQIFASRVLESIPPEQK